MDDAMCAVVEEVTSACRRAVFYNCASHQASTSQTESSVIYFTSLKYALSTKSKSARVAEELDYCCINVAAQCGVVESSPFP